MWDSGEESRSELLHERNRYQDPDFPVGMYVVTRETIVPDGRGYMDLHWHEELQFTVVTDGYLEMQVNGQDHRLQRREAIFINQNCLHVSKYLSADGRYVSFNFPSKMLAFFSGSRMEQQDVWPYVGSYAYPAIVIRNEGWQSELVDTLLKLCELFSKHSTPRYEYAISLHLATAWYILVQHMGEYANSVSRRHANKQERMRTMLTYIHQNFGSTIRLKHLARAANISEGECCRCFQEVIHQTPNQYIINYRITRATELLNDTDHSITEIALETGFSDSSHFIQSFKKKQNMTPAEYRACTDITNLGEKISS